MDNPRGWHTPFPFPQDAAHIINRWRGQCQNLGLWLDRYVAYEYKERDGFDVARSAKKREGIPTLEQNDIRQLVTQHAARQRAMLDDYKKRGYSVTDFECSPDWRLTIGLGGASVLETGLTTHRVYGFPYLPGSSVKGLTRAYALLVADDVNGKLPKDREKDSDFLAVFGDTNQAGRIIFFDAIPVKPPTVELDIINPHVGEYYQGEQPPADYLNPTPIYFLTVGKKSLFRFALAGRDQRLVGKASTWLKGGLADLGAGGKTTAGYGMFTVEPESVPEQATLSAPKPSLILQSKPKEPAAPLEWRRARVKEYRQLRGRPSRGKLLDLETSGVHTFYQTNIQTKGWSPGKKSIVEYAVTERDGKRVVLVRKTRKRVQQ